MSDSNQQTKINNSESKETKSSGSDSVPSSLPNLNNLTSCEDCTVCICTDLLIYTRKYLGNVEVYYDMHFDGKSLEIKNDKRILFSYMKQRGIVDKNEKVVLIYDDKDNNESRKEWYVIGNDYDFKNIQLVSKIWTIFMISAIDGMKKGYFDEEKVREF